MRTTTNAVPDTCQTVLYEVIYDEDEEGNDDDDGESSSSSTTTTKTTKSYSHWGVFSLVDRQRGKPVFENFNNNNGGGGNGDIVIPFTDINNSPWLSQNINMFWDGGETGIQYEGYTKSTFAVVH